MIRGGARAQSELTLRPPPSLGYPRKLPPSIMAARAWFSGKPPCVSGSLCPRAGVGHRMQGMKQEQAMGARKLPGAVVMETQSRTRWRAGPLVTVKLSYTDQGPSTNSTTICQSI